MAKRDGFIGDAAAVLVATVVGIILVYVFLMVVEAREDDPMFNCYLSGDMKPGPACPWHGFVNLDKPEEVSLPVYQHLTTSERFEFHGPVKGHSDRVWLVSTKSHEAYEIDLVDFYYNFTDTH